MKLHIEHRPLQGFPNYEITPRGDVFNIRFNRYLTCAFTKWGYQTVRLTNDMGRVIDKKVHRLVASTFLGEQPSPKHQVNHIDGVKSNNRVENLEWVTGSENIKHAFRVGLKKPSGGTKPKPILLRDPVSGTVVRRFESGSELCRQIGLSTSSLHKYLKSGEPFKGFIWSFETGSTND